MKKIRLFWEFKILVITYYAIKTTHFILLTI